MSASSGYIFCDVTHSLLKCRFAEQRFDPSVDLSALKDRLHLMCGSSPLHMRVFVNGREFSDANVALQSAFPSLPAHGTLIHIEDTDPHSSLRGLDEHEMLSRVQKFTISDEEYAKRTDNAKAWKERMIAQKKRQEQELKAKEDADSSAASQACASASSSASSSAADSVCAESEQQIRSRVSLHSRCEIRPGARRGVVKYIGVVPELGSSGSIWIGVDLDEPSGKHDGAVKGKRYFTAKKNHGTFVKPNCLKCGDFPERDPFDEDEKNAEGEGSKKDEAEDIYKEL